MMLLPSRPTEQIDPAFQSTSNPRTRRKNSMLRSKSLTANTGIVFSICLRDIVSKAPKQLDQNPPKQMVIGYRTHRGRPTSGTKPRHVHQRVNHCSRDISKRISPFASVPAGV